MSIKDKVVIHPPATSTNATNGQSDLSDVLPTARVGCADIPDIVPVVMISPTFCQGLPRTDSFPNLRQSPSNLSLHRGLSASPIPWRDASMEVLVSPNDGPQISIEDFDDCLPEDSPFLSELAAEFDTISMCEMNTHKSHGRLRSENSPDYPTNSIDKLIDRKFACYGVSPRLTRKTNDFLSCNFTPVSKGSRPSTFSCPLSHPELSLPGTKETRDSNSK